MNRKFLIILSLVLCLFVAGQIKLSLPQSHDKAFAAEISTLPEQEKLIYKAKFWGIHIGAFIITNNGKTMLNNREVYCFELKVKTLPFFSILLKTKDRYVSYMDTQELVVLRHEEYVGGGDLLESAVDFDYTQLTATYTNFLKEEESTVKIPTKLHDILSGGFYLRMMDLELGDTVDIPIYADQKIYHYTGAFSSIVKIKVPRLGRQDAYYCKPHLFIDGEEITKISAELYFSTTTPTKTLRATLNTRFGDVNVVLVEDQESL